MLRARLAFIANVTKTLVAVLFTLRWLTIPYTIVGSTWLSFGSQLLLRIFGTEELGLWSYQQTSGVLFIVSAILTYGIVVMFEPFEQLLIKKSSYNADLGTKKTVFYSDEWKLGRRITIVVALMALLILFFAVLVLSLSYHDPSQANTQQPGEVRN